LHLDFNPGGKSVDHLEPHANEAPLRPVSSGPEPGTRANFREYDFQCREAFTGTNSDGNPAALIAHPAATVGQQFHVDPSAKTGAELVHGIRDQLVKEMV